MGIVNNALIGASGQGGYFLTRSVRLRASASAYLSRTFSSNGNQQKWTWSGWVKAGRFGSQQPLFNAYSSVTDYGLFTFSASGFIGATDTLKFYTTVSNATQSALETAAVFRDPASWYHIVLQVDTTQATASNRIRIYVNGVQQTLTGTQPSQNANIGFYNTTSVAQQIGALASGTYGYFDGYMTEINFIDGQALTPSSFGSTNTLTGVWQPARYGGAYGTNGFYLPFTDNSGATATTIGKDFSGNGNNWTPNNISVTAGVTYDSMTDVPTLTSATAANYCVINPIGASGSLTISGGNLNYSTSSNGVVRGTLGMTNTKIYWEFTQTSTINGGTPINYGAAGLNGALAHSAFAQSATAYTDNSGNKAFWRTTTAGIVQTVTPSSFTVNVNDIIQVAYDGTNGKFWFGKNNTWYDGSGGTTGDPSAGSNPVFTLPDLTNPMTALFDHAGAAYSASINFGQRPFSYTPPTGYVALNTYNLSTSTIVKGNTVMDATLWTGNSTGSTTQTITNAGGFKPDFLWGKSRSAAYNHVLIDSVRGVTKLVYSDLSNAEVTNANALSSFNSNGFTVGTDAGGLNDSGKTFVGWQWQAGQGTTSTNTNGTITSTVSVNASAGFSIVTYTGTGANATVGHGLGVAPQFLITKDRSGGGSWQVYHQSLGNTGGLYLNGTNAFTSGSGFWNNTSPTSSTISIGTNGEINTNGRNYIIYAFASIAGYSAFGSWQNNNSTDGTFVYLGFSPAVIILKNSDNVEQWYFRDIARQTYNVNPPSNIWLQPNTSNTEAANGATTAEIDVLSNGFKIRTTNPAAGEISYGTRTYIYGAWAANPFKNSLAR